MRALEYVVRGANREFFGAPGSGMGLNGLSLVALLRNLDPESAASMGTYEGYSAWSVAYHLAYCKYIFCRLIPGAGFVGTFPYREGIGGFSRPLEVSSGAWHATIAYLVAIHEEAMKGVAGIREEQLEQRLERWEMSIGEAAIWICSHDTYHLAQIRNMAVPGFRGRGGTADARPRAPTGQGGPSLVPR